MKNNKDLRHDDDGKGIRVWTQNSSVFNISGLKAFSIFASQKI